MTRDKALERRLERLPRLSPDPNRARRVKARCRAQVERRHRRLARREAVAEFASRVLAPAAVGGVCVVWLAFLLAVTLELIRLEHPLP
jgi:hypothetical protein